MLHKVDAKYLTMALEESFKSPDPSTKVGAVLVSARGRIVIPGHNTLPDGIKDDDPSRWERPRKYLWVEHAERNALYAALRKGYALPWYTMYVTGRPCAECARAIVGSGIRRLVIPADCPFEGREDWLQSVSAGTGILTAAGVHTITLG